MKLILKEYLSSLKERGELDAILPDLLSQLGLNVFSRPGRGTRQDGVDVGAVGSLDGGSEKVYLITIKPGDLTRSAWNDGVQAVRPSLDEIQDSYIPNRLPGEHKDKDIVICICCGGDVQEQVRSQLSGYMAQRTKGKISFEEWNGDKLSELIQNNFLREDLLPKDARSLLRKSLALLDEPDVSYRHFSQLIASLSATEDRSDVACVTAIRQISICLWILFAWSRNAGNLESTYLSGELALLHAWNITRSYSERKSKPAKEIIEAFQSILSTYHQISNEFLAKVVLPNVDKQHGISSAIRASCSLDVNLKLFDILGRLAIAGLWQQLFAHSPAAEQSKQEFLNLSKNIAVAIQQLIDNNPALLLPIQDDQAIDISIALLLYSYSDGTADSFVDWLSEMLGRAKFSFECNGHYPCNLDKYSELLEHPKIGDDNYRSSVTAGSILYPTIGLWGALYDLDELFDGIALFQKENLAHCNFQFWYPDDTSEEHFYINSDIHGAVLSHVNFGQTKIELLKQIFDECKASPQYKDLSAVKNGLWPLIIVGCRHYRMPIPLHLLEQFYANRDNKSAPAENSIVAD